MLTATAARNRIPAMGDFLYSVLFDGKGGGRRLSVDDVDQWSAEQGNLWVHLDAADPFCREWLDQQSSLPVYAHDALLDKETRPQSVLSEHGVLVVLRGVNTNPGADPEDMVSVQIWVERHRVISTRRRRLLSAGDINDATLAGRGPASASQFLPTIVERLADRIGAFVDAIEDTLDQAEQSADTDDINEVQASLSSLRRQIASVRRFLAPQRDALDKLNRQTTAFIQDIDAVTIRQEADRITRHLEDLDLARERAIVLQEELKRRIAQEQNERMYVLSLVAAIFLPLSFITGLLGMNVGGMPGVDSGNGFAYASALMAVAAFVLVIYFKLKRWL